MTFTIEEYGLYAEFLVRDNGVVELRHFLPAGAPVRKSPPEPGIFHPILEIHETGKSTREMHAYKHNLSGASLEYRYAGHTLTRTEAGALLQITLRTSDGVRAVYHMRFFEGVPVVQVWTTLKNEGPTEHPLEYVSSFVYQNLCGEGEEDYFRKTDIYVPRNGWSCEGRWQKCDCRDLNLTGMAVRGNGLNGRGMNGFSYTGKGSWSSAEYLPMGIVEDRETGTAWCFQVEHSGQWHIEYGTDFGSRLYAALSGATETEHGWWYNLSPGAEYTTVPVCFGAVSGGAGEAVAALTRYRRAVRRRSPDDGRPAVVFNDYMNCLWAEPEEETEKRLMDAAAELGCEYYCIDAGWYDDGFWWDRVGEWKESAGRFPGGLKGVLDYGRSLGLKMGLWIEIEVMGTASPLAGQLPDSWFVCRHGRRHMDNHRYLLDFRSPDVRSYCTEVMERLIRDYGVEYFKVDYNVTMGVGSELDADCPAQAMREHYECLYQWYRELFERHPNLLVENCGSGAMRCDYGMLKLLALQSVSDQTDALHNAYIGVNAAAAIAPEQAGMWVYPYEDDREHVILNVVSGILLRPYISGKVWELSPAQRELLREGVALYRRIRGTLRSCVPFFPMGFASVRTDEVLAFGMRNDAEGWLAVVTVGTDTASVPLSFSQGIREVSVCYPSTGDCQYAIVDGWLTVKMPCRAAGRLFHMAFDQSPTSAPAGI